MRWALGVIDDARMILALADVVGWKAIDVREVWRGLRISRVYLARHRAQLARVLS